MREPTITKCTRRGKTEYQLRAWENGKRVYIGIYPSLADAEVGRLVYMQRFAKVRKAGVGSVEAWVREWIKGRENAKSHRAIGSTKALAVAYLYNTAIGDTLLRELKPDHVRAWIFDLSQRTAKTGRRGLLAESTMRNALRMLSVACRDAIEAGRMRDNPTIGIRIPKRPRSHDTWAYLSLDEIKRVLSLPNLTAHKKYADRGTKAALTLAIYGGLRAGELWGLRWEDVHLSGPHPHVVVRYSFDGPTKGGRPREVPLLPPAVAALTEWRDHKGVSKVAGLVWPGKGRHANGERKHRTKGHDAAWPTIRKLAEVRPGVRFHDLRHTCASHLVSGSWGIPWRLEEVQAVLGHTDAKTTQRYAHLSPGAMRGTAARARAEWKVGS